MCNGATFSRPIELNEGNEILSFQEKNFCNDITYTTCNALIFILLFNKPVRVVVVGGRIGSTAS